MNFTLQQLAFRNVKKYKKSYIFVAILTVLMTIFVQNYLIVQKSLYDIQKLYDHEHYGEWYKSYYIENPEAFEKISDHYNNEVRNIRYAFLYVLDNDDGHFVAYGSDDFYDLCHIIKTAGHYPESSHDIVIEEELARTKDYQLFQNIELTLGGQKQIYQIVGFVKNVNDAFPVIYTGPQKDYVACKLYSDRSLSYSKESVELYSSSYIKEDAMNLHGYDYNQIAIQLQDASLSVSLIAQVMVLCGIIYSVLAYLTLDHRTQEMALLRGIGMTTKQLFVMILYEVSIICFISVLIGSLCSLGVSYMIMLGFESQKGYFVWQFSMQQSILGFLIVLGCSLISQVYPIYRSSHQALSGTFETQAFQYIQIRYKQLKYQNKMRLAWRELMVHKKIHLFFIAVLCILSCLYIFSGMSNQYNTDPQDTDGWYIHHFQTQHYATVSFSYRDEVPDIKNSRLFYYQNISSCVYNQQEYLLNTYCVKTDNFSIIDKDIIKGRYPENDNEVMINGIIQIHREMDDNVRTIIKDYEVGDWITIQGQQMHIVGEILPYYEEGFDDFGFDYFPIEGIYMSSTLYEQVAHQEEHLLLQMFYDNDEEKNALYAYFAGTSQDILQTWQTYGEVHYMKSSDFEQFHIDPVVLSAFCVLGICLCYLMNKHEMMNMSHDYALMKLIGMTRNDFIKKHVCKGVLVWMIVMIINIIVILLGKSYYQISDFPMKDFIYTGLVLWIVCVGLYVIPLKDMDYQIKRSE